jgi:hypothetical protein
VGNRLCADKDGRSDYVVRTNEFEPKPTEVIVARRVNLAIPACYEQGSD